MTTPTDLLESLRATRKALAEFLRIDDEDVDGLHCYDGLDLVLAIDKARAALTAADLAIAQAEQPRSVVTTAVVVAMGAHGGSFSVALATAWYRADPINRARLESAFPELFAQYAEVAEKNLS